MASKNAYALGLDFGTSSVRALVVRCADGAEVGTCVVRYATGKEGVVEDSQNVHLARQHPRDYLYGLHQSIKSSLKEAEDDPDFAPEKVVGIGVDTTGSTPLPVDAQCQPLALDPRFEANPDAMAWLWKDHTAYAEAAEITQKSNEQGLPYMAMVGGTYSSEWFWSKILRCARVAPDVFEAARSWVELADFIPAYLVGVRDPAQIKRSVCAAGHKGLFNPAWKGLPSKKFLGTLDPRLAKLRDRLYEEAYSSDQIAGKLDWRLSEEFGLPKGIPVAVGAFDAHMGAVGSGVRPGTLVKIMGTSTCDIMVAPVPAKGKTVNIPGMCGVVNGSVLPDMLGLEAGQSAVGDLFNWFVSNLCPPEYWLPDPHVALTEAAYKLKPGESGLLALDWNNGNRTVLVDQRLTGLLVGQTLRTSAPEVYRALVEATAFGALTIIRRMEEHGAIVQEVVNCGGIAEKSPFVMQIYADVCNRPMKTSRSAQTCALGAAIFGAVVGGAYPSVLEAQKAMTATKPFAYQPNVEAVPMYARLYAQYAKLHDGFGIAGSSVDLGGVMKELLNIRDEVTA